jgi:hypothetical protein
MLFMLTLIHSTIVVIMATYWWNGVNSRRCSTASVRNRLAARTGSRRSMRLISCPNEGFKRPKSLKKSHCRV